MNITLKRLRSACRDLGAVRKVATHVATLTSSRVLDNDRIVLPPGYHPFIVPLPAKHHRIDFFIGETGCELRGDARKHNLNVDAGFAVVFLEQEGATKKLDILSERLGVEVYGALRFSEQEISDRLLTPNLEQLLRRLDFTQISKFTFNPLQMCLRSSATEAGACAELAIVGRDLLVTAFDETCERSKHEG